MPKENIICTVLLTRTNTKNIRTPSSRLPDPYYCQSKLNLQSEIFKDFPLLLKDTTFHGKVWNNVLISTRNVHSCIYKRMPSTFTQKGNEYNLCQTKKTPSMVGNDKCLHYTLFHIWSKHMFQLKFSDFAISLEEKHVIEKNSKWKWN